MKNSLITLLSIMLFFAYSCSTPEGAEKVSMGTEVKNTTDLPGIEGSWKLIQFKETGDSIYTPWPQDLNPKIKLVTNTHFTWVSYDDKSVIASGGGTYEYKGDNYVENIDFFEQQLVLSSMGNIRNVLVSLLVNLFAVLEPSAN